MDENNQIDEFDKMFYDYFDNNKEVPQRIHDTIYSAFDRRRQKRKRISVLKRVAMIVISFGVMTTGIVFADDIINFITSLFTNSTDGIESAVQNGYVQTVDMEFVYDNDIGVKIDNIVLDDTNLDISFVYNYQGKEQIDYLELYEYSIRDGNDNVLYNFSNSLNTDLIFPLYVSRYNESILIEDNIYKDSTIYTSNQFPYIDVLKINIKSLKRISNDNYYIENGNWNIEINLDDKLKNNKNEFYTLSHNEDIKKYSAELNDTSLKINLEFKYSLDELNIKEKGNIVLKDSAKKEYRYRILNLNNNEIYLEYDISKYMSNIDELELKIYSNKEIILKLEK